MDRFNVKLPAICQTVSGIFLVQQIENALIKFGYSLFKICFGIHIAKAPTFVLRKVGAYMRSSIMLLQVGFSPVLLIETFFDIRWALFP